MEQKAAQTHRHGYSRVSWVNIRDISPSTHLTGQQEPTQADIKDFAERYNSSADWLAQMHHKIFGGPACSSFASIVGPLRDEYKFPENELAVLDEFLKKGAPGRLDRCLTPEVRCGLCKQFGILPEVYWLWEQSEYFDGPELLSCLLDYSRILNMDGVSLKSGKAQDGMRLMMLVESASGEIAPAKLAAGLENGSLQDIGEAMLPDENDILNDDDDEST
jgi:hypothetical protein